MYIQHPSTPSHSPYSSHRHTCVHYLLSLFAGKNFSPHLSLYVFTSDFHPSRFVCTKSQVAPLRSAGALPYIYICIFHLWVVTTLGHYFYLRTSLQILLIFNLPLTRSAGRLNTIILVSSFLHFIICIFQHFDLYLPSMGHTHSTVGDGRCRGFSHNFTAILPFLAPQSTPLGTRRALYTIVCVRLAKPTERHSHKFLGGDSALLSYFSRILGLF